MDECSRVVLVGVEWPLLLFWASAGSGVGVEWLLLLLVQSRLLLSSSMVLLLLPVLLLLWLVEVLALVVLILILVLIIIVRNFSVGVAGGDVVGGTSSAVHHACRGTWIRIREKQSIRKVERKKLVLCYR